MKLSWLDVRLLEPELRTAVIEEAIHQGVDAVVSDDPAVLAALPPTVRTVYLADGEDLRELPNVSLVIVDAADTTALAVRHPEIEFGRYVEIVDAPSLDEACRAAREERWSLLKFRDPTKIPLEIVIAAASGAEGNIITVAEDVTEAEIIFGVLEHGSDGVAMAPGRVGDATALLSAANAVLPPLALTELTVTGTAHVGMGERACVDTCSYLGQDEGILVGSHSKGMILCVSETHPLPYMPTRPFRVNAGAIHSYTLGANERTNYLSELKAGASVTAVNVKGEARLVTVGRVKIESRPLISVDATAPDGTEVNLILQDDWHVRVLGPGGVVLNSTELKAGDAVLGYLPTADRHVGYPINEFCREQ